MDIKTSRSTLRGLKKCPSCSKYNGHKAKRCRNRECPENAKVANSKQNSDVLTVFLLDAVALVKRGNCRLFSVKIREKCEESVDTRSFVKITDKIMQSDRNVSIVSRSAICYVDSCKYDFPNRDSICQHVKEASDAAVEAIELKVNRETLNSIAVIPDAEKNTIWNEICKTDVSPMVQKINKKIFVVRHENSPAGFVHCELSRDIRGAPIYSCSCKVINILLDLNDTIVMEKEICRHMMLLSAALNSDTRLQNLYKSHLDLMKHIYSTIDPAVVYQPSDTTSWAEDLDQIEFITSPERDELSFGDNNILNNVPDSFVELQDCQIELMDNFQLTDQLDLCADDLIDPLSAPTMTSLLETLQNDQIHIETVELKAKNAEPAPSRGSQWSRRIHRILDKAKITKSVQETERSMDFEQWLAMFVERINLAPDFNNVKNPIKLNFTVHTNFFNCLHTRFSKDPTKKKLPNKCEVIQEGEFAGKVSNNFHFSCKKELKRILENDLVKLETERHFNRKSNSSFKPMTAEELADLAADANIKDGGRMFLLKPTEYKTFIKLGHNCNDGINHYFVIKWIADTLPMSQHGEMMVEFEVGRLKNGQPYIAG